MQAEQPEVWAIRRGMGGGQYWHISSERRERIAVFTQIEDAELVVGLVNSCQSKPDQETPPPVTSANTVEIERLRAALERESNWCCEVRQDNDFLRQAVRNLLDKPGDAEAIGFAKWSIGYRSAAGQKENEG